MIRASCRKHGAFFIHKKTACPADNKKGAADTGTCRINKDRQRNDPSIGDAERALAVIYMLFGDVPENSLDKFMEKATVFLQCGKEPQRTGNPDMDFNADRNYIVASFMSDYRIDLDTVNMHFWKFIDLIKGLTEHCALSRVRELRSYDLSDIKDAKFRSKIIKAQEAVRLPVYRTAEEQSAIDEFEKQLRGE